MAPSIRSGNNGNLYFVAYHGVSRVLGWNRKITSNYFMLPWHFGLLYKDFSIIPRSPLHWVCKVGFGLGGKYYPRGSHKTGLVGWTQREMRVWMGLKCLNNVPLRHYQKDQHRSSPRQNILFKLSNLKTTIRKWLGTSWPNIQVFFTHILFYSRVMWSTFLSCAPLLFLFIEFRPVKRAPKSV